MSILNNDYKELYNREKESVVLNIVEEIIDLDLHYDSSVVMKSKNFQETEIDTLLALLIVKNLVPDENYHFIVEIITFIVYMKPISVFKENLKFIFFDIASEIVNELCYSTKIYLSYLTLSLFLQLDESDKRNIIQNFKNFFEELSNINSILSMMTSK